MSMFDDKTILISGGTGSFGGAVVSRLLSFNLNEIRILSRDEKKQDEMRKALRNDRIKFYIGDVRDYECVLNATRGVDYLFHAAALKQVPSCEFHPLEAVKTNILGTENVIEAAINNRVERVICLSTDKAVYPINAMGISKAMMEKLCIAKARNSQGTVICVTRYGNVMASRGSVIPLFKKQILNGEPITITDPNMTRFMMTLQEAVDLVFYAFENGKSGEIYVQRSPAATVGVLAQAVAIVMRAAHAPIMTIGTRHGEKLYEVLLSREEMVGASQIGNYFCVAPDLRNLNYDRFFEKGELLVSEACDYNSHNATQLDVDEVTALLVKTGYFDNGADMKLLGRRH
jgi:UDP-N-acetylglucosamine 4,6-dehydratase